jgi:peptide deformylase
VSALPLALLTATPRTVALPQHALRAPAAPVDFAAIGRDVRARLVDGLVAVLFAGAPGAGLAAPMAGLGLRIVVLATDDRVLALANPRIASSAGETRVAEEGNLCLPGVRADVPRPSEVTVAWQDPLTGRARTEAFGGWEARVLQHEIEILDGRLFLDLAQGRPLGAVAKPEDLAARSAAKLFGEPAPTPRPAEPLTVATFDPDLAALPGTVVRRPSEAVDLAATDPSLIRRLAEGLLRTQFAARGVGLAAPQVGIGLRLAAIDERDRPPLLLINPEVLDRDDRTVTGEEGCLTMPGLVGAVPRADAITLRNHRPDGEEETLELRGRTARIVQHEVDHLDGVLFTDRMAPDAPLLPVSGPARADEVRRALRG